MLIHLLQIKLRPQGGRWVGASSTGGQCIMPERNLTVQDTPTMTAATFVSDCNVLGGTN